MGNQTVGCHRGEGYCPDGNQCDRNAQCVRVSRDRYDCECRVGYAGDGRVCGPDQDLDGWPDYHLGCSHPKCQKVLYRKNTNFDYIYMQYIAQ